MGNQFTKYTGTVVGAAGSLITALDAALVTGQGWTTPKTGTNKKVYQPAAGSLKTLGGGYRVDDNGTGTGGAKEALVRGAESWSDVDTPVNPFPTNAQSALTANSLVIRKSADAGTARAYKLYADDSTAMLFIQSEAAGQYNGPVILGAYNDRIVNDAYNAIIVARAAENSASMAAAQEHWPGSSIVLNSVAGVGAFVVRGPLGVVGSAVIGSVGDGKVNTVATNAWIGVCKFPNIDGTVATWQREIVETVSGAVHRMGWFRGLRMWGCDSLPYSDGTTIGGTGLLAGRSFEILTTMYGTANTAALVEISATLNS